MQTVKMLGRLIYQADVKPKGARNFRRADMSALFEYEIASITADDMVRDAVVVMPPDNRPYYGGTEEPKCRSYAGWESSLWRPMIHGNERLTVEQYEQFLRGPRATLHGAIDPIFKARIASASQKDHARHGHLEEKDIYDSGSFVGAVEWTNKPDAVVAHNAAAKLVIAVDGEIWCRHPGPTWQVQQSHGYDLKFGSVLLEPDAACYPSHDLFRPDRVDQARELCVKRWGKAEVRGVVEHMDSRFVTRDDIGCMFHTHLSFLIDRGEQFLPYLKPEATQAFAELYRVLAPKTPLTPFATTDTNFVTERLAILREAMTDRSLPHRLLAISTVMISSFDKVEERIRLDRRTHRAENTVDDDAIASLSVRA